MATKDKTNGKADRSTESVPLVSESIKVQGEALAAKVKSLMHEGNVHRIVVQNDHGHTVMEIPVTAGVIVAVALPVLIAVGAIAALANDWTIQVHRDPAHQ